MRKILLISGILALSTQLFAQENQTDTSYWKKDVQVGVNINQAAFTDNWAAGGVNSIAASAFWLSKLQYEKEKNKFTSNLDLQYGITNTKGLGNRKSLDRILFENKYNHLFDNKAWSFFGSATLLSQFAKGYNYANTPPVLQSGFFSPAFITEAIGLEYRPVDYFGIQFGLASLRQTLISRSIPIENTPDGKNYGVPVGKFFRNEVGFQLVADFSKDIAKNLNLKSRYQLFGAYNRFAHTDHRLDVTLTAKVNNFINVNITGIAIYDDDISNRIQATEAIALGFVYKLK